MHTNNVYIIISILLVYCKLLSYRTGLGLHGDLLGVGVKHLAEPEIYLTLLPMILMGELSALLSSRKFSGLRSLWQMPFLWQ